MPFRGAELHFQDIIQAIGFIDSFIAGMTFTDYLEDDKTRAAVERKLQIVTEAAYRLTPADEALCPTIDWKDLRGMGNVLRHAYHRLEDERIWQTVTQDLPILRGAVEATLRIHFAA